MPPFGLFRSEFQIVSDGFAHPRNAAAAALVCLVTLAFLGLTLATTRILFRPNPVDPAPPTRHPLRGEPSRWMVAPVVAGVAVLLVLGLAPPSDLVNLLNHGAASCGQSGDCETSGTTTDAVDLPLDRGAPRGRPCR